MTSRAALRAALIAHVVANVVPPTASFFGAIAIGAAIGRGPEVAEAMELVFVANRAVVACAWTVVVVVAALSARDGVSRRDPQAWLEAVLTGIAGLLVLLWLLALVSTHLPWLDLARGWGPTLLLGWVAGIGIVRGPRRIAAGVGLALVVTVSLATLSILAVGESALPGAVVALATLGSWVAIGMSVAATAGGPDRGVDPSVFR